MMMLIVYDVVDCQTKKRFKYLLCVIDVFNKYAWVKPLKDKKGKQF